MHTDDPVLDLTDRFTAALNSHGLDAVLALGRDAGNDTEGRFSVEEQLSRNSIPLSASDRPLSGCAGGDRYVADNPDPERVVAAKWKAGPVQPGRSQDGLSAGNV